MGDGDTTIPMLADQGEDQEWVQEQDVNLQDIVRQQPGAVVTAIKERGLQRLTTFTVHDSLLLDALGEGTMLTFGSASKELDDPQAAWLERLERAARRTRRKRPSGWQTDLPVEAAVVAIRCAACSEERGILRPLLLRAQRGGMSDAVWGFPAVQAVIEFKWETWARKLLLFEFVTFLVWLASFTTFVMLFQDEDLDQSLREVLATRRGAVQFACVLLSAAGMAPLLYLELCTIAEYGWAWLSTWNTLDTATYTLQIVISVLWLTRTQLNTQYMSTALALQVVLLWFRLQYFSRVFRPTKTAFVDTFKAVLADTKWFLVFLGMLIFAFSVAFYILFRLDQDQPEFRNIWHALVTVFSFMLGGFDYNLFWDSHNPEAATILFVVFEFLFGIVLLNLLVAVLTNSMDKVTQAQALSFLRSKAGVIDELESSLPHWLVRAKAATWFPPWVHVLRVDLPDRGKEGDTAHQLRELREQQAEAVRALQALSQQAHGLRAQLDAVAAKVLSDGRSAPERRAEE